MKSPVVFNIILALIFAVIAYFVFPNTIVDANLALAIGLLVGGIIIPAIGPMFAKTASAGSSDTSDSGGQTLYVGNLPYRANEQAVNDHFAAHGKVLSVRLMKDRRTGKRKGYGFVEMASKDAEKAIRNLNDTEFQDRTLKVRMAKDKLEEEQS
jgi:hypothetical protein